MALTGVGVEMVQDISNEDALANGVMEWVQSQDTPARDLTLSDAKLIYQQMWDSTDGKKQGCSWGNNPWVWKYEFQMSQA